VEDPAYGDDSFRAKAFRALACAAGLTEDDRLGIEFCSVVQRVATELPVKRFATELGGEVLIPYIILPTDGDLEDIPRVLQTIHSTEYERWPYLVTLHDEGWPTWFDDVQFVLHLYDSAKLRSQFGGLSFAGRPSSEIANGWNSEQSVKCDPGVQTPIIATLERLERKIDDRVDRSRAEYSLRAALGDALVDRLCADARTTALNGEYLWLTPDLPAPRAVIGEMATAFELHLKSMLRQFADDLIKDGVRYYPEVSGNAVKRGASFPGYPEERGPWLLGNKGFNHRLTLKGMQCLLENSAPRLREWLARSGVTAKEIAVVCSRIRETRNKAVHGEGFTREQVADVRAEWLCSRDRGLNIFACLMRADSEQRD
jgi:hypothetical protein